MFGKACLFCEGFMFAMVIDNALYLRVDDGNRTAFKEAEDFRPLPEAGLDHRPFVLARPGEAVRRTRRACRMGGTGARSGTPRRREESTAAVTPEIDAATRIGFKILSKFASPAKAGVPQAIALWSAQWVPAFAGTAVRGRWADPVPSTLSLLCCDRRRG